MLRPAPHGVGPVATTTPVAGKGVFHLHRIAAVVQPEREGNASRDLNLLSVAQAAVGILRVGASVVFPSRWPLRAPSSAEHLRESSSGAKLSAFVATVSADLPEIAVDRVEVVVERWHPDAATVSDDHVIRGPDHGVPVSRFQSTS